MERTVLLLIGLGVVVSGCIGQTQDGTTTGNGQNTAPPQDTLSGQQVQTQGEQTGGIRTQDNPSGQQGQKGWRGFSQAAVDACTGKSENETCEFKINETSINGTCTSRRGGELTCFPSRFNQRPPQEMLDACAGKSENETCEFKLNENMVNGSCRSRQGGELSCFSSDMGRRFRPDANSPPQGQNQNQAPPTEQGMPGDSIGESSGGN